MWLRRSARTLQQWQWLDVSQFLNLDSPQAPSTNPVARTRIAQDRPLAVAKFHALHKAVARFVFTLDARDGVPSHCVQD